MRTYVWILESENGDQRLLVSMAENEETARSQAFHRTDFWEGEEGMMALEEDPLYILGDGETLLLE